MRADVGGTIKRRTTVLPGGKQERRASRPLFFFVYMTTRTVILYFFRHINNETNKNRRGNFGVQGSPCPSESPVHLTHFAAGGTGY